MRKISVVKHYWNPIVYLFGTAMMFITVFFRRAPAPDIVLVGLFVWVFWFYFLAWSIAISQAAYGWWQYRRSGDPQALGFCWSGACVAAIYAITFILFSLGYYPDA